MQRLIIGLLLLASLLAVGAFVWSRPAAVVPYAPKGPGASYLALGDSLAAGFTVGAPEEAYVARIAAGLERINPDLRPRNLAVPGETSATFRARQLPRALQFIAAERAAGRRVSPITIDIGGNDLRAADQRGQAARAEAVKQVEANLGYALDQLLAATRDRRAGQRTADIAVMNYYNPYAGDPIDTASAAYWIEQLNAAIARAAAARGVPVADVASAFGGGLVYRYTYIAVEDIHANADGHQAIAEQFWQALGYPGAVAHER